MNAGQLHARAYSGNDQIYDKMFPALSLSVKHILGEFTLNGKRQNLQYKIVTRNLVSEVISSSLLKRGVESRHTTQEVIEFLRSPANFISFEAITNVVNEKFPDFVEHIGELRSWYYNTDIGYQFDRDHFYKLLETH